MQRAQAIVAEEVKYARQYMLTELVNTTALKCGDVVQWVRLIYAIADTGRITGCKGEWYLQTIAREFTDVLMNLVRSDCEKCKHCIDTDTQVTKHSFLSAYHLKYIADKPLCSNSEE